MCSFLWRRTRVEPRAALVYAPKTAGESTNEPRFLSSSSYASSSTTSVYTRHPLRRCEKVCKMKVRFWKPKVRQDRTRMSCLLGEKRITQRWCLESMMTLHTMNFLAVCLVLATAAFTGTFRIVGRLPPNPKNLQKLMPEFVRRCQFISGGFGFRKVPQLSYNKHFPNRSTFENFEKF